MAPRQPTRKEDAMDPIGKIGWPKEKGRDGERTPMQWDTSKDAGFSTADKTWLPVPAGYTQRNVAVEEKDPHSILNFYKQLIALRRQLPALRDGSYIAVNRDNDQVLSYLRKNPQPGESVLVVLNMSPNPATVSFNLISQGINRSAAKPLLSNPPISSAGVPLNQVRLAPFGTFIGAVQ